MADKTSVRAQVKELTDKLAEGVKDLFSSEKYMEYLRTMSRFHTYSTRNTLLINMQMPGATKVAGFRSWQTKFERHVKKGEKGIRILAPTPYTIKRQEQARDPETREFLFDDEGLPVTEEVEVHIPRFKAISVFDVSQTEGKPLPQLVEELAGDVRQYELFMDALRAVSPLPIKMEALPPNTDGECRYGDSIAVRQGMSETQTILATIHEIGHAVLHDNTGAQEQDAAPELKDTATREVEAESVSYAVCAYYGIETDPNSFGYLATWSSGKGLRELNASLDVIRKTAAQLIEDIDGQFRLLAKERGIDLATEMGIEDMEPAVMPSREEAVQFAREYVDFMSEIYQDGFIDGGPAAEQPFIEEAATRLLAGDVQEFEDNLTLAYEKDEEGEPIGPDPSEMLNRLQAFREQPAPEQAAPALSEAELAQMAFDRLAPGDMVHLLNATTPVQLAEVRENDMLFVAPALGIEVNQTHGQVLEALRANPENQRYLDAAAQPAPDLAPNQEVRTIDGVNFVYTNATPEPQPAKEYALGFGHMGNGLAVWNRLEEKDGDFVTVAHIAPDRTITYYDDAMPEHIRAQIENEAQTSDMTVSATQDTPVFNDPPGQGAPEQASPTDPIAAADAFIEEIGGIGNLFGQPTTPPPAAQPVQATAAPDPAPAPAEAAPDPTIALAEQEQYGYTASDMLPMRQERALELFDMDYTVFTLHTDGTEEMVFDRAEIEAHDGIFGIEEDYWYETPEFFRMRAETEQAEPVQAAPVRVDSRQMPDESTIHERLDAVLYEWDGPDLDGLSPRAMAAALTEWQQSKDTPLGEQEADLLMEYAVATEDVRLTKDLAEYLGRAGFERGFGSLNPAVLQDVRDEIALLEAQDPVFMLARDINQYYNDIDLYDDGRPFTRGHNRDTYRELLEGSTSRTLDWLRAHIEPTRVERATALADRIEALDFDTPFKLAEDIHAFITSETGTKPTQNDIVSTFAVLRDMDDDAVATLEVALRVSRENEQITDQNVPAELLDRLNAMRVRHAARFAGEPMVKVTFTESPHLIRNQLLPLSVANELYRELDAKLHGNHQGYDKTDFSVFYVKDSELHQYNGQYNIGDGDGGLISHIAHYSEQVLSEKDRADEHEACRDVYNHLVPYLMYHCDMAGREKQADALLADHVRNRSMNGWRDLVQSARLREYVSQCRSILNTKPDDAQLPALPLPGEVVTLGEQVAHMPLSEDAKDFILQNNRDDTFAIYQLKAGDELRYHRFSHLEQIHQEGNAVERGNYVMTYMAPMAEKDSIGSIIQRFNIDHPEDFTGHSLSTSDILVFNMGGDISTFYLNGYDVIELPHFIGAERNLSVRLAEDIDAFLYDYGKAGQHNGAVNDGPVASVDALESAVEGREPVMADIGAMLRFVVEHDADDAQRSKAARLLSRLEGFNPPRREEQARSQDKLSLLGQLQAHKKAASQGQAEPKPALNHNTDREV